MFKVM